MISKKCFNNSRMQAPLHFASKNKYVHILERNPNSPTLKLPQKSYTKVSQFHMKLHPPCNNLTYSTKLDKLKTSGVSLCWCLGRSSSLSCLGRNHGRILLQSSRQIPFAQINHCIIIPLNNSLDCSHPQSYLGSCAKFQSFKTISSGIIQNKC